MKTKKFINNFLIFFLVIFSACEFVFADELSWQDKELIEDWSSAQKHEESFLIQRFLQGKTITEDKDQQRSAINYVYLDTNLCNLLKTNPRNLMQYCSLLGIDSSFENLPAYLLRNRIGFLRAGSFFEGQVFRVYK